MKFTFICEDVEEGTRVLYSTPDTESWIVTLFYYPMFLLGCGFVFKDGYKLGEVAGEPTDNLLRKVEYE